MPIDFTAGFFGALRKEAGEDWHHYTYHPFLEGLARGTLPQLCFRRFLTQDYLFLIHFSRAYALLAAKSTRIDDIHDALDGLKTIAQELPTHIKYCAGWGISEAEIKQQREAPQTIAYTRYVMDIGLSGDRLDLLAALLPCIAGYAEIGLRLAAANETVWQDNPYADWIRSYKSPDYLEGVAAGIDMLNRAASELGGQSRFNRLSEIFTTATRLESDFWQMGLDAAS